MALGKDTNPQAPDNLDLFFRRHRQNERTWRAEVDGSRLPDFLQTRAAAVLASAAGVCQQNRVLLMVLFWNVLLMLAPRPRVAWMQKSKLGLGGGGGVGSGNWYVPGRRVNKRKTPYDTYERTRTRSWVDSSRATSAAAGHRFPSITHTLGLMTYGQRYKPAVMNTNGCPLAK